MTATLAGSLAVLALVDSTSFGTLLVPLWLLAAPGQVRVGRVLLFLTTVAVVYLLVGVVLLLVGIFVPRREGSGSGRVARWRERAIGGTEGVSGPRGRGGVGLMTLSVTAVALELPTMLPYLAATGLIAASDLGGAARVGVLAGYCLVMVAPALVLLAARVLARRWVEPVLARLARWVGRASRDTLARVLAIIGLLLARDAWARLPEVSGWIGRVTGG